MFWTDKDSELPAVTDRAYRFLATGTDYHRPFLDRWLSSWGFIADVGCGVGRVANVYDRQGRRAVGLDLDLKSLKAAHGHHGVPSVCGDAMKLPFRDGTLAAFVGLGIIEFDLDGGRATLGVARRVLRPDVILHLTVTLRNLSRRKTGRMVWRGIEVRSFTADKIHGVVADAGFDILLTRPSSLAWGLGPFRRVAGLLPRALVREDERALTYRLLFPILPRRVNSLLVVARKSRP